VPADDPQLFLDATQESAIGADSCQVAVEHAPCGYRRWYLNPSAIAFVQGYENVVGAEGRSSTADSMSTQRCAQPEDLPVVRSRDDEA
jgi:hypothetical protein